MTVETQAERGRGAAAAATRNFAAHPRDRRGALVPVLRPPERRPRATARTTISASSTSTTGRIEQLTAALADRQSPRAPAIHAARGGRRRQRRDERLRAAACAISTSTTIRSPIGRSRRACCRRSSPRRARSISAKSICRGASTASRWRRSDRIISISTCSPMTAAFPLADAYRVELGVDAGAGPRRFTLFFIPPRTKLHDHPRMAALLCAGRGATGDRRGLHRGAAAPRRSISAPTSRASPPRC